MAMFSSSPTSSPVQSPDGTAARSKSISTILSLLDSPPDHETEISDTQPVKILKGVVAYVEVRATFENRSKAVTQQLLQLGATVESKFTNDVTHVIFKDGKKSTRDRARKKGVHLVSVLWIEACKKQEERVPEQRYPANIQDDSAVPLAVSRLKKSRSMQPKEFEEDLANSAEKVERRRKMKEKRERWKVLETPITPLLYVRSNFFVAETQSMSPMDILNSPNISVPETPPSMRRRLEEIRRRKLAAGSLMQESPLGLPGNSPVHKKLFDSNTPSPSFSSSAGGPILDAEYIPITSFRLSEEDKNLKPESGFSSPALSATPKPRNDRLNPLSKSASDFLQSPHAAQSTCSSPGSPLITLSKGRRKSTFESPGSQSSSSTASPVITAGRRKSLGIHKASPLVSGDTKVATKKTAVPSTEVKSSSDKEGSLETSKNKGSKRRLMTLVEDPTESLVSPQISSNTAKTKGGILDFSDQKRKPKIINCPDKTKKTSRKRKTEEAASSDSSGSCSKVQKRQRMSPGEQSHNKRSPAKVAETVPEQAPGRGRRKSLAVTPVNPPRTSRRRSCVPSFTPTIATVKESNTTQKQAMVSQSQQPPNIFEVSTPQNDTTTVSEQTPKQGKTGRRRSLQPKAKASDELQPDAPRRSSRRSSVVGSTLPQSSIKENKSKPQSSPDISSMAASIQKQLHNSHITKKKKVPTATLR